MHIAISTNVRPSLTIDGKAWFYVSTIDRGDSYGFWYTSMQVVLTVDGHCTSNGHKSGHISNLLGNEKGASNWTLVAGGGFEPQTFGLFCFFYYPQIPTIRPEKRGAV